METRIVNIQGLDCHLVVNPLIVLDPNTFEAVNTGRFTASYSFAQPGLFLGQTLTYTEGTTASFATIEEAFTVAQRVATASLR